MQRARVSDVVSGIPKNLLYFANSDRCKRCPSAINGIRIPSSMNSVRVLPLRYCDLML